MPSPPETTVTSQSGASLAVAKTVVQAAMDFKPSKRPSFCSARNLHQPAKPWFWPSKHRIPPKQPSNRLLYAKTPYFSSFFSLTPQLITHH